MDNKEKAKNVSVPYMPPFATERKWNGGKTGHVCGCDQSASDAVWRCRLLLQDTMPDIPAKWQLLFVLATFKVEWQRCVVLFSHRVKFYRDGKHVPLNTQQTAHQETLPMDLHQWGRTSMDR